MDKLLVSPHAPPAPLPFTDTVLARLASELARGIYPLRLVLQQHKIDPEVFKAIVLKHPRFQQLFREAHALWHSSEGIGDRISAKSAVLIEQWLEEANRLYHDHTEPLSAKNEMMKILAKMAKVDGAERGAGELDAGQRVVVNINLSAAGRAPVIIDKMHEPRTIEGHVTTT